MSGDVLDRLRGGLIVSVQARPGSALDDPAVLSAMARAAQDAGAAGLRMQGVDNITAARLRTDAPMIGIIKREYLGFEPYITPTLTEVRQLIETGVEIIAYDATDRKRPDGSSLEDTVAAIHGAGKLAMADCATTDDALCAASLGADIVASTLAGYTPATAGTSLPALKLVAAMRELDAFVVCEGGVHSPEDARRALAAGADAVVVGTAITDLGWLVREFAGALAKRSGNHG